MTQPAPETHLIGTQEVLEPWDIGPPSYAILDWEVEETIELLLEHAVEIGEMHSQMMIAAGRGPTPRAHRACTQYHAIEIIRRLQADLAAARALLDNSTPKLDGDHE